MVRSAHSTVTGTEILIQNARLIADLCHRYPANVRELSRRNPRRVCVRTDASPLSFNTYRLSLSLSFGLVGTTCGLH